MNFKLIIFWEILEDKCGSKFLGVNFFFCYLVSVNLEGFMLCFGYYYYMIVISVKNFNDIRGWYIYFYLSYLIIIVKIDVNFFLSVRWVLI